MLGGGEVTADALVSGTPWTDVGVGVGVAVGTNVGCGVGVSVGSGIGVAGCATASVALTDLSLAP